MVLYRSSLSIVPYIVALFLIQNSRLVISQPYNYVPASPSVTSWTAAPSAPYSLNFTGGRVTVILRSIAQGPGSIAQGPGSMFGCGFFCYGDCQVYLFSIFTLHSSDNLGILGVDPNFIPQVVWSANRNTPIKNNATLELTKSGGLVLKDSNRVTTWSTKSLGGKFVGGLNLTDEGNLVLLDKHNLTIWQSFEYPTDSLLEYQKLVQGQKLTANASSSNWTEGGSRSDANPFGSIRLESDGHMRGYDLAGQEPALDVLPLGYCDYPMVCGKYGVFSNSQCSCPAGTSGTDYFILIDYKNPHLGCSEINALTCEASQYHAFLELENVAYFSLMPDLQNVDLESCKQTCLRNCSCKAAIFHYYSNFSEGECYMPIEIFSLKNQENESSGYRSIAYIKVQDPVPTKKKQRAPLVVGLSVGTLFALFTLGMFIFKIWSGKEADDDDEEEENYFDQVPGMANRFSYEDLKAMTQNFNNKLGEGGFGTVFQGTLIDGTKIAVKRLDGFRQIKKSFLAEVATIGSIHHVNLVRMIGFCAEKSHRLLVYEYMSNGSLDKWIFHKTYELLLSWKQRKKIILDIAKGLSYLHEDCRQKILHLDIKPENILLDEDFNGKVSDFGLSKLIDRDQSQVVTTMRGTPGYLAPEWLNSTITEKVDVYSFGIVMMEILCGRRNVDRSQPEEAMHLLPLFKKKYEENQVLGLADKCCEDMQSNEEEVMNMMKVVAWCLQTDFARRPSMSMVVKVLEGVADMEYNLGLDNSSSSALLLGDGRVKFDQQKENTLLLPSILSQAR